METDLVDILESGCDDPPVTLQENNFKVSIDKAQLTAEMAHKINLKATANLWGYASILEGGSYAIT